MTDLFNDGGVIKRVVRSSVEGACPHTGEEVAIVYSVLSGGPIVSKNLVYTVGTEIPDLFLPLRTLDRIVCGMKRNEKCSVTVSPAYSGSESELVVELTLVHIKLRAVSTSLASPLGDFQEHLLRNPDVMSEMMTSPLMQSLLSNPETMRSMMGSNPQMQQLMEQNPELNSLMSDPQFLQQSMEAMRNPNMMREMMRNTDRAMSNIESLPGGSAALHKLYNEVQAPLFEATQMGGDSVDNKKVKDAKGLQLKYSDVKKQLTVQPMPNPWVQAQPPVVPNPWVQAPAIPPIATPVGPDMMSGMAQMMQDPAMQQLMASMMRTENRPVQQSPQTIQQMFNPANLQAMQALEQSLGMMGGQPRTGNVFGNFLAQPPNPETLYSVQLGTLRSMGFTDVSKSIRALQRTGGNVDRAAALLISEGSVPRL